MPGGADTYIAYGRGWAQVSNTPFREYKHWTHEGGISTPLIAHWPTGVAASRRGALEAQPGQLVDIMATCLDVAGASYPSEHSGEKIKPLEGTSLRPVFAGKAIERTRPLAWEHEGNRAVRDGKWKLVAKEGKPWELYDLAADRSELHDLASSKPDRVKKMSTNWEAWAARANVLPLGAWRGPGKKAGAAMSQKRSFTLKAGDHLDHDEAPNISGRAFTVTAKFDTGAGSDGVIVAQGGSSIGYALHLTQGQLHFLVRNRSGVATASKPGVKSGSHTATARLDSAGALSLTLDDQPPVTATQRVQITAQPADGLDVGSDEGGAVGPYKAPNKFNGTIESITIEIGSE
jgi:arylsulfatase